jgi:hypothetical protein
METLVNSMIEAGKITGKTQGGYKFEIFLPDSLSKVPAITIKVVKYQK